MHNNKSGFWNTLLLEAIIAEGNSSISEGRSPVEQLETLQKEQA